MANHIDLLLGLKILPDRVGLISSSFVLFVWLYGHLIVLLPILLPHYKDGNIPFAVIAAYVLLSLSTIVSYLQAMFSDPGKLGRVNTEKIDWRTWEKCVRCCSARPPRSHHCRKCGFCVIDMDHHCQWINNCVGKNNFRIFSLLLSYAFMFVSFNIIIYHVHKWGWLGECNACAEVTWVNPLQNPVKVISYLIAVPTFVGISLLLMLTCIHISIGMTTIEAMEDPKSAMTRSLKYGSCFPKYSVLTALCGTKNILLWMLPCRSSSIKEDPRPHII